MSNDVAESVAPAVQGGQENFWKTRHKPGYNGVNSGNLWHVDRQRT
jgi:hypothetical protein